MKVTTVWKTPDGERLIAYMARVSNPTNQANEKHAGLIKYLIKHKHWSPFEMVNVCMEIECTRDIARQILRHRSFSFQEFSQRYAVADGYEFSEARLQDEKNRQNSIPVQDREMMRFWQEQQQSVLKAATVAYESALNVGIAREVARKVLPEGLTTSRMYMNGTLRSWMHYVQIRTGVETQKEHREIAQACAKELTLCFPTVMEALNEF